MTFDYTQDGKEDGEKFQFKLVHFNLDKLFKIGYTCFMIEMMSLYDTYRTIRITCSYF